MTAATVLVYLYLLLRNSFRKPKKVFKTSVNARFCCPLRLLSTEPDWISPQTLYCQKLESLPKTCAAGSMCLCMCLSLLVFTQLFSEVARSQPAKPTRKQNLTLNSQLRSFNVMHFGITEKPAMDCISPYNNVGLLSKVSEKMASENAGNCRSRQPLCRLTPLPGESPQIFA